jgi:hypothetical protein
VVSPQYPVDFCHLSQPVVVFAVVPGGAAVIVAELLVLPAGQRRTAFPAKSLHTHCFWCKFNHREAGVKANSRLSGLLFPFLKTHIRFETFKIVYMRFYYWSAARPATFFAPERKPQK